VKPPTALRDAKGSLKILLLVLGGQNTSGQKKITLTFLGEERSEKDIKTGCERGRVREKRGDFDAATGLEGGGNRLAGYRRSKKVAFCDRPDGGALLPY